MNYRKVALLDVDGTLIDSNDAHALSWVESFAKFGFDVPFDRVKSLIGKGGDKLMPEAIKIEKESPRGEEIATYRAALFAKSYLPSLRAFPRAKELIERLQELDVKLVVASSAGDRELEHLLAQGGLEQLLRDRTSSSDADQSKPAPDIVQAALKLAGCKPHDALMLGDTPWDIQSANRAGVQAVALRCGGWSDEDLGDAVAVYQDPSDLLSNLERSPFVVTT